MRILVVSLLLMTSLAYRSMNQTSSESPAPMTLIRAARLLDPRTGNVLAPAAALIEIGAVSRGHNVNLAKGLLTYCHSCSLPKLLELSYS